MLGGRRERRLAPVAAVSSRPGHDGPALCWLVRPLTHPRHRLELCCCGLS